MKKKAESITKSKFRVLAVGEINRVAGASAAGVTGTEICGRKDADKEV